MQKFITTNALWFGAVIAIFYAASNISVAQEPERICDIASPLGKAQITSSELLRDVEAQEQYLQRESNSKTKQDRSERLAALKRDVLRIKEREYLEGVHRCEMRHINAQDYIREIVLRIEDCAIKNFPKKDGRSIYGNGVLQFTIDGWGTLVDSSINKSSANPLIDAHMLKLVQASAPFGDVPGYMLNGGYKLIRITSDFEFKNTGTAKSSRRPKERCHFKENAN